MHYSAIHLKAKIFGRFLSSLPSLSPNRGKFLFALGTFIGCQLLLQSMCKIESTGKHDKILVVNYISF